jgi:hypothetical protein
LEALIEENNFDIIAISEIYPKKSSIDHTNELIYKISGYDAFLGENGKRGVIIYAKKKIVNLRK